MKFQALVAAFRQCGLWILILGFGLGGAASAEPYAAYANRLVNELPADARFRADLEAQLHAEANRLRASKGVAPLEASTDLRLAARAQAVDMMLNGFVGHRASTGQDFESRMRAFVISNDPFSMPRMAENAARETQKGEANATKASRLFQQWVGSRGHRKSLLNATYQHVSTGVVQRGNKIWAVQIFWNALPGKAKAAAKEKDGGVY
jgi:uncharacterized protein YkwD